MYECVFVCLCVCVCDRGCGCADVWEFGSLVWEAPRPPLARAPSNSSASSSSSSDQRWRPGHPEKLPPPREMTAEEGQFCESISRGEAAVCHEMIASGVMSAIWQRPADGNSPLHIAAEEGKSPNNIPQQASNINKPIPNH